MDLKAFEICQKWYGTISYRKRHLDELRVDTFIPLVTFSSPEERAEETERAQDLARGRVMSRYRDKHLLITLGQC